MQTLQLLGGAEGRAAFLRARGRTWRPAGCVAVALADALESFTAESDGAARARPLRGRRRALRVAGRWRSSTRATARRSTGCARSTAPTGRTPRATTSIRLDRVDGRRAARPRRAALGFTARPARADPGDRRVRRLDGGDARVADRTLRVCALYPDLMNIYADRGNMLMLERRCAWRGHRLRADRGGPRRAGRPRRPRPLLPRRRPGPRPAAVRARTSSTPSARRCTRPPRAARSSWAICGGIQLLGDHYELGDERVPGIGLVDLHTVRSADGSRLIGNVAIEVDLPGVDGPRVLAGFENHGGRTYLGAGEAAAGPRAARPRQRRPLGLRGRPPRHRDRHLPPRPAAAQERLVRRLAAGHGAGPSTRGDLAPLDDRLEDAAHASARRAAGV